MVLHLTGIQLFQILKERLGEKEAEALVTLVSTKVRENKGILSEKLATKEDFTILIARIAGFKVTIPKLVFAFFVTLMLAIIGLYFKK